MPTNLKEPIKVKFDRLFLDPNNPRLGVDMLGYDDPDAIFPEGIQADLECRMRQKYEITDLEDTILSQGWVPIDAILVWDHPKKRGHYVVVEGNSRTTALRGLRKRHQKLKDQYEKHSKKKGMDPVVLEEEKQALDRYEKVLNETENLTVLPVDADTSEELQEKLPNILGVRHVKHAQQWKPYATGHYMANLYRKLFEEKRGPKAKLAIDKELVKQIADIVSLSPKKARQNIQAAVAFDRFKLRWEEQLPAGEKFEDDDHYYFEQILQYDYPREQFGFDDDALELPPEKEKVLFQWAFSQPSKKGENSNVFYKAESIGQWQKIKRYDDQKGTHFAIQIDVENPDKAVPMAKLEADYLSHRARRNPTDVLSTLIQALKDMRVEDLQSPAMHIKPLLEEVVRLGNKSLKMLAAARTEKS